MSLHLGLFMEMNYPIQSSRCVRCLNLTEPIILRKSNSIASIRNLELKSVGSLYNVFEIHSKEVKAMEKDSFSDKEEERRRKIGLANKGKVPWNKGKKHSEDTRRRIKQRTIEALRNPKVRNKMSKHQRAHSDETKEKIRASVKQVWVERLRLKRLKENFLSLWFEHIAEGARKGGSDEVELEWDSYEKAKQEISFEIAEETKMRVEARTEKTRRVAERKKERKERNQREVREPKKKKDNASSSKLKKRLTKIHKKKTSLGKIDIGTDRVVSKLEKLDLEMIRKERRRGDISLADQIQAAKNQRGFGFFPYTIFQS